MARPINFTQLTDVQLAIVPAVGRPGEQGAPYPEIHGWVVAAPQADGGWVNLTGVHDYVQDAAEALQTIRNLAEAGISLAATLERPR